ncbi:MAG: DUF192 domain-containing protein [Rhodocyclaceae bacterium]|nr:DUF192 domain-containing protein [Rhodocyclaceae bacterium]
MRIRFATLGLMSSILLGLAAPAYAFGSLELTLGMYRVQAEVASTDPDRQRGLMFRKDMPESHGMLFVFPVRAQHCMWMKNTLLPLSVAFLDEEGRIINIEDMAPQTETNHCASQPARYALEMNRGWFKQRGFGAGAKLGGIERAPAPQ